MDRPAKLQVASRLSPPVTVIIDDPGYNPKARRREFLSERLASPVTPITIVSRLADAPKRGRPVSDKPKSPRAEYQRELMRKRRSKT
jgi:Tfp pilus assembly protein FimV